MAKQRNLSGVAHDIAHHAASGLSYLSPHFANALRASSVDTSAVELLRLQPYPDGVGDSAPLRLALQALHTTALAILSKYGFEQSDVSSIRLHGTPAPWDDQGYLLHTRAVITAADGKQFDSGWLAP